MPPTGRQIPEGRARPATPACRSTHRGFACDDRPCSSHRDSADPRLVVTAVTSVQREQLRPQRGSSACRRSSADPGLYLPMSSPPRRPEGRDQEITPLRYVQLLRSRSTATLSSSVRSDRTARRGPALQLVRAATAGRQPGVRARSVAGSVGQLAVPRETSEAPHLTHHVRDDEAEEATWLSLTEPPIRIRGRLRCGSNRVSTSQCGDGARTWPAARPTGLDGDGARRG